VGELVPEAVLRATSVSAGYGGGRNRRPVLHDVDLEMARGETVGVVGESGSGKSTLAKVLVGQLRTIKGGVRLDGADFESIQGRALRSARGKIQLIPQDLYGSLDPRITIRRVPRGSDRP